jgi:hypothetical protein
MAEIPNWHAAGDWFDVCKCTVPCPCTFAQPPTSGDCQGVLVWHINDGRYGDVPLDGLSVVAIGGFEGNLWTSKAKNSTLNLVFDSKADQRQQEALQMIFGGQAGGKPAEILGIWGAPQILGVEQLPIEFEIGDKLAYWQLRVPGKIEARAEALGGPMTPAGERVQTLNPPGSETGGRVATWGVAVIDRVDGFGLAWNRSGNSSKHIPFDWSGPGPQRA